MERLLKETFPEAIKMEHKVELIVPSTYDKDMKINNSAFVEYTLKNMALIFGGSTAVNGRGGWVDSGGRLIEEEVTKVYSFTDDLTDDRMRVFFEIVAFLKETMKQESIGFEINNKFYLI